MKRPVGYVWLRVKVFSSRIVTAYALAIMSTYSRHHAHFPAVGLLVLGASCSGTEDKPPLNGDAGADSGAEHAGDDGTDATEGSNENSDGNSTGGGNPTETTEPDTDTSESSTVTNTATDTGSSDTDTHTGSSDDTLTGSSDDTLTGSSDTDTLTGSSDSGTDTNEPDSGTDTNEPDSGTDTNEPDSGTDTNEPDSGTDAGGADEDSNDGGTDGGTTGDPDLECLDADDCDFSVGVLTSEAAECIFDTYIERVSAMECIVQCDSFTLQVDWTPPPSETATEATPLLQVNATPIELPEDARVQPRTGGTLSTLSQVSDAFNECGTPKFEVPSQDAPLTAELTILVGEREVTCVNRHGQNDDVTRGIRITQQLQTECGWGVEIESDELRGNVQCGVPARQDRISAVDLDAGLINPQLVDRDPSGATVVAGADLPGVGPWQLTSYDGQQIEIDFENPNDAACWQQQPPAPDGPWAQACAEGTPEPVFQGTEEATCPAGCVLETRERPWAGFNACFCDFDATWTEAIQHCRSAGLEVYDWTVSPCGGDYVFDNCGYPRDDVWHASPNLNGNTVVSCPSLPLPPHPEVCFATKNTYLYYNDVEELDVYERSRVSSQCGETKSFYCDLGE